MHFGQLLGLSLLAYLIMGVIAVLIAAVYSPDLVVNKHKYALTLIFLFSPIALFSFLLIGCFQLYRFFCQKIGNYVWSALDFFARFSSEYWYGEREEKKQAEKAELEAEKKRFIILVNSEIEEEDVVSCQSFKACVCKRKDAP